jgi:long-subunit fatty acid transport protein
VHFRGVEGTPFEPARIAPPIDDEYWRALPHTLNVGFGWQIIEPLFVGFDLSCMNWSAYDRIEINYEVQTRCPLISLD